jgi:hypothetical protein
LEASIVGVKLITRYFQFFVGCSWNSRFSMPVSDDEDVLIVDVDVLVTKIKRAGIHFDAELDVDIRRRIRANDSLEARITKWENRRKNLQRLLDDAGSGLSGGGGAPAASVVAASCAPSEPKIAVRRTSGGVPPGCRPTLSYKIFDDGTPPAMAEIHVDFIKMCVERLRANPATTARDLVVEWNDLHAGAWTNSVGRATGKADHFFGNHYVTMAELNGIVDGKYPHPVIARSYRSGPRTKRERSPSPSPPPEEERPRRASKRRAAAAGTERRRRAASTSPAPPSAGGDAGGEGGAASGTMVNSEPQNVCPGFGLTAVSHKLRSIMI